MTEEINSPAKKLLYTFTNLSNKSVSIASRNKQFKKKIDKSLEQQLVSEASRDQLLNQSEASRDQLLNQSEASKQDKLLNQSEVSRQDQLLNQSEASKQDQLLNQSEASKQDKQLLNQSEVSRQDKSLSNLIKILDINTLVVSGGAMKGLLFIGIIKLLIEYNIIKKIKYFFGTSFGSILVTCLVLGWDYDEINRITTKFPIGIIINYDIDNFIENYGLVSKVTYETLYKKIITYKGYDANITFKQLYNRTGKELNMIVYDLKNSETIVVNYKTFPDLMVWEGLYMTTALPVLVPPYEYQGNFYIDGGVVENFSIERINMDNIYKTIGINTTEHSNDWITIKKYLMDRDIVNYLGYSLELMKIIFTRRPLKYNINTNFHLTFSESESGSKNIMNSLNFSMTDIEKKYIINNGYEQGKKQIYPIVEKIFFNQLKNNKLNLKNKNLHIKQKDEQDKNDKNIKKYKYHEV